MTDIDSLARYALESFRAGFSGPIPPPFNPWDDVPAPLRDLLRVAVMVGRLNSPKDETLISNDRN